MDFKVGCRFVVFCVCCALMTTVFAQPGEMVSRHYSMKDGLPDEGINAVIQDSLGFIWLGTWSGLCKFDGYRFTNYRNNPASSNSLGSNLVNGLMQDKKGRIWIAHTQGVDLFDPKTEKFIFHWPQGKNKLDAQRIVKRRDAKFWICTNQGVFVADPETLSINKNYEFPSNTHAIGETRNGSVVYISNEVLHYIDSKTGKTIRLEHDPLNPSSIGNAPAWNVMIDQIDRIWIGTYTSLELFNPAEKSFTHFPTQTTVLTIHENEDGSFFLGCGNGLFVFDPKKDKKIDQIADYYHPRSIIRDNQGIVWAATLKGLLQLNSKNKGFNVHKQFGSGIGHIVEDANNEIWLLGYNEYEVAHTLYRFNPSTGKIARRATNSSDSSIRSFFKDSSGNVWTVSSVQLEKFDPKIRKTRVIHLDSRGKIVLNATIMDSDGVIWIGGWNGIRKFDPVTGVYEKLTTFPHSSVHSFLEDSNKNLWIASTAGLARYNLRSGALDFFNNQPDDPQSLSGNVVYQLLLDIDKNIWVGTNGGLNRMIQGTENSTPRFISWQASRSDLPNDDVYCIVDGGDGTLWISCGNMVSHFYPGENTFRNYNNNDGLSGRSFKGMDYMNGKGLRSHNGSIFLGSLGGLVVFHPDSLKNNNFVPPVVISNFSIQNQRVPVKETEGDTLNWKTPLTNSISHTKEIRLTHEQNDFNFEFAALNYINSEQNQYKYKLEPYQEEWIETSGDDRVASYTNIDPGEYTFRVKGSNNDGIWNEQGASIMIVVAPPWWQTWWAYSLYVFAIATLIIYWRNYEIKRLRLKNQADHLRELDQVKTRFFTNISHEFRTPITLIQGPLKEMHDKAVSKAERSTFGIMLRNAQRLSKLINQLLDLSKLEAGKMTLHASKVELVQFLREIASSYESLAANKNFKYFFNPEVAELPVYIDMEKMEKVVHNLLSNAFKFTKEGGEIALHLKSEGKKCSINVKDSGIGIPSDQLDKIFDRFHQVDSSQTRNYEGSGLGIALAKELVELHHGTISVESTEGKGTTFTVALRLGKDHLTASEIIEGEDRQKSYTSIEETFVSLDHGDVVRTIESPDQPILLIVEDNADMRHYIRKTFSDNYQIIEAVNGIDGLDKAQEIIPDLIISDVMMPEMDGYKFCEQVKSNEKTSHVPVILLTAKADSQSKMAGLETGADDYLSKPFDAEELKLIVRNRIEQRRKIRERFSREITLEPKQISITSFDEKFLNKVMTIIEDHMSDEHFSIDELSREAGYSNMHFYRKIKALAGETPSQFLRTIRLKRAAELLRAKSDNVTQIAYSVGFNSLSYFNKCFKQQFGVTPGQFAEENVKSKVR